MEPSQEKAAAYHASDCSGRSLSEGDKQFRAGSGQEVCTSPALQEHPDVTHVYGLAVRSYLQYLSFYL